MATSGIETLYHSLLSADQSSAKSSSNTDNTLELYSLSSDYTAAFINFLE